MNTFLDDRILRVLKIFASTKFVVGMIHRVNGSALIVDIEGMYIDAGSELITVLEIIPEKNIWISTLSNQIVYVQPMNDLDRDVLIYDAERYWVVRERKAKSFNYHAQNYYEKDDLFNLSTQGYSIPVLTGLGYLSFIRSELKYAGVQFNDVRLAELIDEYPEVLDEWVLTSENK